MIQTERAALLAVIDLQVADSMPAGYVSHAEIAMLRERVVKAREALVAEAEREAALRRGTNVSHGRQRRRGDWGDAV